ncbi:MAG: T9SS type A sorting domain-containing protein [Ignavibacterium sp.]|nr:T9SS type A sorting domain-containing protein [Ignavibacterium sp.]
MKPNKSFHSMLRSNRKYFEMINCYRKLNSIAFLIMVFLLFLQVNALGQEFFNYSKYLFDPPSSLSLNIEEINRTTGYVRVNGFVSGGPIFISWDWGDGSSENGWFPMTHTYADISQNYILIVVANYAGGFEDTAETIIRFVPPSIAPITLSDTIAVHIPENEDVLDTMGTRLFIPPADLTFFDDNFFPIIPRSTIEYVLTTAAKFQKDFVNNSLFLPYGKFEQYMFRDLTFSGAYSLWYTNPVSFGVGDPFMLGNIDYSSLFHEMGHNITLNTPPSFYYGDVIGGNANAIYSESMAQIFQHATGYEVVNNYDYYGLSEDLMMEIKQQVIRTIKIVRDGYDQYILNNKPFASWNDPSTPEDETMLTFLTIAYKFCEHAEYAEEGYMIPLKRMMTLLQGLCPEWAVAYDPLNNTADADTFRATLLVRALSEAFQSDLKDEFRALNFPVSDQIYNALPVELVSFTATAVLPSSIRLDWTTATEINNYGFEIERKSAGNWQKIGFVEGHGNSNSPKQYSFTDNKIVDRSKFHYRLKQIDNDGKYEYSNVIEVKVIPTEFVLSQNYPNPFNSSSIIKYSIPKTSHVSLKILNMLGEVIETLVNEEKTEGNYDINFNASSAAGELASGVYFYRLQAGSFVQTKKMMLMK